MCIPLLELLTNLLQRHNDLDPYFPILPEEQDSIDNVRKLLIWGVMTSAIITPLIQVGLACAYNVAGHPWSCLFKSIVFGEEAEEEEGLPDGWYDIFNDDSK